MSRFLISCGGTGGHLAPGIALAEGLIARGHVATLLISQKKVDARLIAGYPQLHFRAMPGTGFAWQPAQFARCIVSQIRAFRFCSAIIRAESPDAIIGFGGFTSAPVVLAGRLARVPVTLHESNRVPGRAIRTLGRFATRVYLPSGIRLASVSATATRHAGLPVRREIVRSSVTTARIALDFDPAQKLLVIFGGSQGASALNVWARENFALLAIEGVQLCCVTGLGKGESETLLLPSKTGAPVRARFVSFCDRVAELLSAADLVVSRAGAGTLAELVRCEAPAILVPFPHAADDHQRANAAFFAQQGAGLVLEQKKLAELWPMALSLLFDELRLENFRANLRRLDQENALELMLADLEPAAASQAGLLPASATDSVGSAPAQTRRWDEFVATVLPLLSPAAKFKREEPLAPKTTIRIGGAARVYAEPASPEDLRALLAAARAVGIEVFALGRGSNLLVPDEGVDGLVVSLVQESWASFERRGDGRVWVGAGLRLKNLCGLAAKAGLVGFEFLEGIPGSVGGALRMNAGAMGGWMFDVVEEVQLMTLAGELRTLKKSEMHVDYRHCAELNHAFALGALLRPAAAADIGAVNRQIDVYRRKRQESQPREPSAGCIFKNPPGGSAGRLIDLSGLKGARVGDAEVSAVHANFIVNRGAATSADLVELVRRVRAGVRQAHGVDLEPEVLFYGKKWKDIL